MKKKKQREKSSSVHILCIMEDTQTLEGGVDHWQVRTGILLAFPEQLEMSARQTQEPKDTVQQEAVRAKD